MAEEPKITFAEGNIPIATINGLPLTVSPGTSDVLAAVHFGFTQAVEMFKVVTQPAPAPPVEVVRGYGEPGEEDEVAPGMIDLASLWRQSPEAREAILARAGLQVYHETPAEPDVTRETMRETIEEGGGIPPSEEGE